MGPFFEFGIHNEEAEALCEVSLIHHRINESFKMKTSIKLILVISTITGLNSCVLDNLRDKANEQFGDQHFKTAIALIELHKIREGTYPETLDSLKFAGEWDAIALGSVNYTKLEEGYELDLKNGWIGKPKSLEYPDEFWRGLGLKKTNLNPEIDSLPQ
jgi:hypothetical protein